MWTCYITYFEVLCNQIHMRIWWIARFGSIVAENILLQLHNCAPCNQNVLEAGHLWVRLMHGLDARSTGVHCIGEYFSPCGINSSYVHFVLEVCCILSNGSLIGKYRPKTDFNYLKAWKGQLIKALVSYYSFLVDNLPFFF